VNIQTQQAVVKHFESTAGYWKEIYEDSTVYARIHQLRRDMALAWIDELMLQPHELILEVGCGAGLTTVALGKRGYAVEAIDTSEKMLDLARGSVNGLGLESQVNIGMGDVHNLRFQTKMFGLVLALGVVPWLHSPDKAIREMTRVLKPGGYLLFNGDNRWRLNHLVDPMLNPGLVSLRHMVRKLIGKPSSVSLSRMQSPSELDTSVAAAGLDKIKGVTFGFGPFSFCRLPMPNSLGVRLHGKLQYLADRRVAVVRSTGAQYLVLSRKRSELPNC
jgi:ubiquinone/menaquinone biosynthesis C-methylase UbiE